MKEVFKRREFVSAIKAKHFLIIFDQKKRIGIREISKQIGISASTFSRVENGATPDLETFFKICKWLNKEASNYYKH